MDTDPDEDVVEAFKVVAVRVRHSFEGSDRHELVCAGAMRGGSWRGSRSLRCLPQAYEVAFKVIGEWVGRRRDHDVVDGDIAVEHPIVVERAVADDGVVESLDQLER